MIIEPHSKESSRIWQRGIILSLGLILVQEYDNRKNEWAEVIESKGAVLFPSLLTKVRKTKHEQQMHWPQEHPSNILARDTIGTSRNPGKKCRLQEGASREPGPASSGAGQAFLGLRGGPYLFFGCYQHPARRCHFGSNISSRLSLGHGGAGPCEERPCTTRGCGGKVIGATAASRQYRHGKCPSLMLRRFHLLEGC